MRTLLCIESGKAWPSNSPFPVQFCGQSNVDWESIDGPAARFPRYHRGTLMPIQITEAITYDYAAINTRTKDMGDVSLTHHWGFDAAAKYQRIGVQQRRLLSTQGGPVSGLTFKMNAAGQC